MLRLSFNIFFCGLLLLVSQCVVGQAVDHLRSERESILGDIERAKSQLKSKRSSRENTLQQLTLVSREVSLREDMLRALQLEVQQLERSIDEHQVQINGLEKEYSILVLEYSKLLQDTYLRSHALDELIYFMSAADFSVAYRRYRLLKEYSNYRGNQGQILKEKRLTLVSLQNDIRLQKEAKEGNLEQLEKEIAQLSSSRVEKSRLIKALQSEEQWLLRSIRDKENQAKELENKILEYIRTANVGTLGNDFSDFEGRLIWPVSKGVIVNRFGEHEHPILKSVSIKNNGIDIQSTSDDVVLAVHSGEVSRVVGIPGYNTAVLVRHGKYLTVYANLREVSVKQGQKVNAGQMMGRIFKEENSNMAVLHFEIWHENQKLDPANWLIK